MARRYTKNTVSSLDEVDDLFRNLLPGVARRMRCGRCEEDVRLTYEPSVCWFLEHRCVVERPMAVVPNPTDAAPSSVERHKLARRCFCCGTNVSADTLERHQFWGLYSLMRWNGVEDSAHYAARRVA